MTLSLSNIKVFDLVKNQANGEIYAVKEIRADILFLINEKGVDAKFHFFNQFVAPTDDEAKASSHLVDIARSRLKPRKRVTTKVEGRKVGINVKKIRSDFEQYDEKLKLQSESDHKDFMEFWAKLVKLIGDFPGRTWGMRTSAKYGLNPCIYTTNDKNKRVVMGHLWGSGSPEQGIHILVIGKYLKPEFKHLFPLKSFFYGKGPSVDIPYPEFKAGKDEVYLNCFRELLGLTGGRPAAAPAEPAKPEPAPAPEEPEPEAAQPEPAPAPEEPKPEPEAAQPEPAAEPEEPKPEEPKPEPEAAQSEPAAEPEEPKPEEPKPVAEAAQSEPAAEPEKPEASEPEPEPEAETSDQEPEPEPEPKASEPEPEPEASKPDAGASEPEPAPEASEPEPEAAKPEPGSTEPKQDAAAAGSEQPKPES